MAQIISTWPGTFGPLDGGGLGLKRPKALPSKLVPAGGGRLSPIMPPTLIGGGGRLTPVAGPILGGGGRPLISPVLGGGGQFIFGPGDITGPAPTTGGTPTVAATEGGGIGLLVVLGIIGLMMAK